MGALTEAAILLVFGLAGLTLFAILIRVLKRWPMLALYAVSVFVLIAWEVPALPALFGVAGVAIKPEDALFGLLLADVLRRPNRFLSITRRHRLTITLTGIVMLGSLLVGLSIYGATAANEARGFLWGIGLIAWLLNMDWSHPAMIQKLRRWAYVTGWALVALFVFHAATFGIGAADSFVTTDNGTEQTGRPLVSGQAMFLTLIAFYILMNSSRRGRASRVCIAILFVTVAVLCQHRSVWAVIAVALVCGLFKLRLSGFVQVFFAGLSSVIVLAVAYTSGAFDETFSKLAYSTTSVGTYDARVDTWWVLIDDSLDRGAAAIIFGTPFGFGYDRMSSQGLLTFNPHNWFVMIYLRMGLLGLAVFLSVLLIAVRSILRHRHGSVPLMIVVGTIVYCWSYALSWYILPFLGISLSFALQTEIMRYKARSANRVPAPQDVLSPVR